MKLNPLQLGLPSVTALRTVNKAAQQLLSLDSMMAARVHYGHKVSTWNPKNAPYLYGSAAGMHLFNLAATQQHLIRAYQVIRGVVANDGMVLVVARQDGFDTPFRRLIGRTGGFYHYGPWLKGCLTNAKLLLATQRVPDLVVSLTPPLNTTALREARVSNVPTVGIIDSNADPDLVDYMVPGNDDGTAPLLFYARLFSYALLEGCWHRLRFQAQRDGVVEYYQNLAQEVNQRLQELATLTGQAVGDSRPRTGAFALNRGRSGLDPQLLEDKYSKQQLADFVAKYKEYAVLYEKAFDSPQSYNAEQNSYDVSLQDLVRPPLFDGGLELDASVEEQAAKANTASLPPITNWTTPEQILMHLDTGDSSVLERLADVWLPHARRSSATDVGLGGDEDEGRGALFSADVQQKMKQEFAATERQEQAERRVSAAEKKKQRKAVLDFDDFDDDKEEDEAEDEGRFLL